VALFLGGWNAPFTLPHIQLFLDPGSLGLGLLFLVALVPVIGTLLLAAPVFLFRSRTRWWVALITGFVLFNVLAGGLTFLWAYISFEQVAGLFWFLGKTFTLVFVFVWLRGTLPRVRIDQLMGFAWKWMLPAALLNLFVTAAAVAAVHALGVTL
jgi:NADH:ubiquinone oxidoreductase subunit H